MFYYPACAPLLPLEDSHWLHNGTEYDLEGTKVIDLDPVTVDFQIQDATSSVEEVSKEYTVGSTMTETLSFEKTSGMLTKSFLVIIRIR